MNVIVPALRGLDWLVKLGLVGWLTGCHSWPHITLSFCSLFICSAAKWITVCEYRVIKLYTHGILYASVYTPPCVRRSLWCMRLYFVYVFLI
jgi:hypothetical protein